MDSSVVLRGRAAASPPAACGRSPATKIVDSYDDAVAYDEKHALKEPDRTYREA